MIFHNLFFSFIISCTKSNTRIFKEPIYNVPESEYEGYFIDYFTDFIIEQLKKQNGVFAKMIDRQMGNTKNGEKNEKIMVILEDVKTKSKKD